MKKIILIWGFVLFIVNPIIAQKFQDVVEINEAKNEEELDKICQSVYQNYSFKGTTKEVENIINEIVETAGVSEGGFELKQCSNINNAVAKILVKNGEDVRYIIYDSDWLESVINSTENDWSGKFVLAHEIGHHLNGHSLNNGGSTHIYELQADYFAGKALANLGASLPETLAVTEEMGKISTTSHPARSERKKEIEKGWKSVKNKIITNNVKSEDISKVAKQLVQRIDEKLRNEAYLTQEDLKKTLRQLKLARSPKYYNGYTEDIWYYEAICYKSLKDEVKAMETYTNYLSIKNLNKKSRIKEIASYYAESSIESLEIFANTNVTYELTEAYFKNKKYDNAISFGNQFLSRSDDEAKKDIITTMIGDSEFEKIENDDNIGGLTTQERIEKGLSYIENQEYNNAFDILKIAANNNNAKAQYLLGNLYFNGLGVTANSNKAKEWYFKSAQQGYAGSQSMIGYFYMIGLEVNKNYADAKFWLDKAVDQNNTSAIKFIKELNILINEDKKKVQDEVIVKKIKSQTETVAENIIKADSYFNQKMYEDAYRLYLPLANSGDKISQYRVGWMLYKGKGVSKSKNKAIDWWRKSAKKGDIKSINYLTSLGYW